MSNIILNEREYAEMIIQNNNLGQKPSEHLSLVARYYKAEGFKKTEISLKLEEFLLKCDPSANIVKWNSLIEKCAKNSDKQKLIEIEGIPLTKNELDVCSSLGKTQMAKLMFTLICVAKYSDIVNPANEDWVNKKDKEIFKMANIATSIKRQSLMLNGLREMGYISFSKKVDNINIKVMCLDKLGEPELIITDYRNLGNQYMRYMGDPHIECRCCGAVVKKTSNAMKYCSKCATEIDRKKSLERWYTKNN